MVISELLRKIENRIEFKHEAYILIEYVTGFNKTYLMCHDVEVNDSEVEKIMKLVEKRVNGMPLQYLTNIQYFYGYPFYVDENVLIPRADTEILVEKCIELSKNKKKIKILDMCTGSGCIAVTLKKQLPFAEVYASDLSEKALEVAKKNAKLNEVEIKFVLSDLFFNIKCNDFDVIISNPPYIESSKIKKLANDVKKEPLIALDGGYDGLDFYRAISQNANDYLNKNGKIYFEIGYNQAREVSEILTEYNYKNIKVYKDYGDNDRVIVANYGGNNE